MVAAEKYIDSLKTLLDRGVASFDSLAIKNSQDPGSASSGGDLGTFAQGRMVQPFNDAAFLGSKGGLYKVKTQFGVHLIKVEDQIFNSRDPKYKVAYISTPITPSEETQDKNYDIVSNLLDNNRDLASLEAAIANVPGMSLTTAAPVSENDYIFAQLGPGQNSRDIVRWAFDENTTVGSVSPTVYTVTDNINYYNKQYVIVGLKSANKAGSYDAASLRSTVETELMNKKKGEALAAKLSASDLNAIASQYGSEVNTANNISFSMSSIPGMGREPKVQAAAMATAEGSVSKPIVGNSGVFVLRPISKNASSVASNIPSQRRTLNLNARNQVNFGLINALKEKYPAEDKRSKFF